MNNYPYYKITSPDNSIHPLMLLRKSNTNKIVQDAIQRGYLVTEALLGSTSQKIFVKSIEEINEKEFDTLKGW